MIDTAIPVAARCSFCGSYQPLVRVECNPVDEFTQTFRFFCRPVCMANWETNQPRLNDAALPKPPVAPQQAELAL